MASDFYNGIGNFDWLKDIFNTTTAPTPPVNTTAGATAQDQFSTDNYKFKTFQEALRYQASSNINTSNEAWKLFKEKYLPYQKEVMGAVGGSAGKPGISETLGAYLKDANKNDTLGDMNRATADVNDAYGESEGTVRRNAARYGIAETDENFIKSMGDMAYEKAKNVGTARNTEISGADADRLARLQSGAQVGLSGLPVISNPAESAASFSGLAEGAASAGRNEEVNKAIAKPSSSGGGIMGGLAGAGIGGYLAAGTAMGGPVGAAVGGAIGLLAKPVSKLLKKIF